MPLYDAVCTECHYEEEITVKLTELEGWTKECPKCKEEMVRKIGNKGGFRLKGSCWARDGYSRHVGDDIRWSDKSGLDGVRKDEV